MRAALLVEPGKVAIGDVDDPHPGPDEVRIAVGGVGLCGSDLSVFTGRWTAPEYPWIMGHEAFGVIDAVGVNISPDRVGETVVVEPNATCFACDNCSNGWTSACANRRSVGMNRPGALAEFVVIPSKYAWSVPEWPVTDLVCVEPAAVILTALRRVRAPRTDRALVVGIGAQGLMMTLALLERGADVCVHDVNPDRVAYAGELGAHPASDRAGSRFPLVVDTVGSPASMTTAIEGAEVGGTVLCLGLDNRRLDLTAVGLVRGQLTLQGSLTYDHPKDFAATIELISNGRLTPGRVVTDEYSLDEAQLAFEGSTSARGKTWIRIHG